MKLDIHFLPTLTFPAWWILFLAELSVTTPNNAMGNFGFTIGQLNRGLKEHHGTYHRYPWTKPDYQDTPAYIEFETAEDAIFFKLKFGL
jgi:hypothetical protein